MPCRERIDPEALRGAIGSHLSSFKDTYGDGNMTPKFHYSWHLPDVLERCGFLPSCWVLERKHKSVKSFAAHVHTVTGNFHQGILRDISNWHLHHLSSYDTRVFSDAAHLLDCREASDAAAAAVRRHLGANAGTAIRVASVARPNEFERVSKGDVVLLGHSYFSPMVARILMLASIGHGPGAEPLAILEKWEILPGPRGLAWKCRATSEMFARPLCEIRTALIWSGTDKRTVIHPLRCDSLG